MTHRRFFCLVLILGLVFSLVGCGESAPAGISGEPSSETETEYKNFEGEGPVQGGIKSDEEIAALQEEEKMYEEASVSESEVESSEAEYVDNTGHEPESYGSGNFQDYWQGDDYFDIEGYLRDIGCDDYYGTVVSSGSTIEAKENETPIGYLADYKEWQIGISPMTSCYVVHYLDTGGYVSYTIHDDTGLESHFVTINSRGTTTTEGVLQTLCSIVNAIDNNPNEINPFQDLNWREY